MVSKQFQEIYANLYTLGQQLRQFVQTARGSLVDNEADNATLDVLDEDLQRALVALEKQQYQVAVIAAMKAGKSTFLNALIGADVLASETESCTVCRTEIKPISTQERPCLVEYREGERQARLIAQGDAAQIRARFLQRTHQIRASNNQDQVQHFALYHPIAAIANYPFLRGFTLVDTPGPNEWQDSGLDSIRLRETAFSALRSCDVVIFILDYSSFKDSTNSELLRELTQQRAEFLQRSYGTVYFVLNKIDRKTEEDRPIAYVVEELRHTLKEFGIINPVIYPASAWQGLLSKLIQQDTATESHLKNFKRFFSGAYARETPDGDLITPSPRKIAAQSLTDSLIPQIEESILYEIMRNAGWNLLQDVAAKQEKAAHALEDILNTRIQGWQIGVEPLRERVTAYKQLASHAIVKIREVKALVTSQEEHLIAQFKQEITGFATRAKQTIHQELDRFVAHRFTDQEEAATEEEEELETSPWDEPTVTDISPPPPPTPVETGLPIPSHLSQSLHEILATVLEDPDNPYAILCHTEDEVEQVRQEINRFCAVLVKDWWTNTHDVLSQRGTQIRQALVTEIQTRIQQISDEISQHLGDALQLSLNINPIQILGFDFSGIDTQVQQQTESYTRWTRERKQALCRDYEVDIQVDDHRSYYEIDLRQTIKAVEFELDAQTKGSLIIVERVIRRQIAEDFGLAEQQINDYIQRFLTEFDRLLKERQEREVEMAQVVSILTEYKLTLELYLNQFDQVIGLLNKWRP
ncbi:MAG: dynamin family protein [Spirulina sp. SIO3F2]|nr:dynamin family protein [Spirulina sp. SIO3F2]